MIFELIIIGAVVGLIMYRVLSLYLHSRRQDKLGRAALKAIKEGNLEKARALQYEMLGNHFNTFN